MNKYKMAAFLLSSPLIIHISNPAEGLYTQVLANEVTTANSRVISMDKNLVTYKLLEDYDFYSKYSADFDAYIKKRTGTSNSYLNYINGVTKYNKSKEESVYEVENLICAFDSVLYSDPVIKMIYEINEESEKNKDKAWLITKKSLIYDAAWTTNVYERALGGVDMTELYKYLFKKNPTTTIIKDLNNEETIVYGLYTGLIGRELTSSDRKNIEDGKGYELLDLTKKQYDDYLNHVKLRNVINEYAIDYIQEEYSHLSVRKKIKSKYNIDIFSVTTKSQRKSIYMKSLINYIYDDETAQAYYKEILQQNGYILVPGSNPYKPSEEIGGTSSSTMNNPSKAEKPTTNKPEVENSTSTKGNSNRNWTLVPFNKQNKYTVKHYYGLNSLNAEKMKEQGSQFYYVRLGNEIIESNVIVSKDLNQDELREILGNAFEGTKWQHVEALREQLIFVNNHIVKFDIDETYDLNKINKKFKKSNVFIGKDTKENIAKLKKETDAGGEKDEEK